MLELLFRKSVDMIVRQIRECGGYMGPNGIVKASSKLKNLLRAHLGLERTKTTEITYTKVKP